MTGGPIDSSLRRPILPGLDRGSVIPDSRRILTDDPLLVMEPGTETLSLQFTDKKGLTDDYGNVYVGYSGYGGTGNPFQLDDPTSLDSEADDAEDGDILVFVMTEQKYLPFSFTEAGVARVSTTDLPDDRDLLQWDAAEEVYVPRTHFEAGVAEIGDTAPAADNILVYDFGEGKYFPVDGIVYFSLVRTDGADPADNNILVWQESTSRYINRPLDYFPVVLHDAAAPLQGNILSYDTGLGVYQTVIDDDWIQFVIEKPTNRQYRAAESLPHNITIIGTQYVLEAGPGSVAFQAGTILAGQPIFITVSGTSGTSAFLRAQYKIKRNRAYV